VIMFPLKYFTSEEGIRKIICFSILLGYSLLVSQLIVRNYELALALSCLPFFYLLLKRESIYFAIVYVLTIELFSRYFNVLPEKSPWLVDLMLLALLVTNFSVSRLMKYKQDLIFLALFLFSALLTVILSGNFSLLNIVGMRRALYPFLLLIVLFLTIRDIKDWNRLLKVIYVVVMIQPVFCFLEYFVVLLINQKLRPLMYEGYVPAAIDSATGTFHHGGSGVLSVFLLMYFSFLIFHEKYCQRSGNYFKYFYILSPLLVTFSGGALFLLPFVIFLIILLYRENISKKILMYIPVALLAVFFIFNSATYFAQRTGVRIATLDQFKYIKRNISFDRLTMSNKGFVNKFAAIQIAVDVARDSQGGLLFGSGPGLFSKSILAGTSATAAQFIAYFEGITSSNFFVRTGAEYGLAGVTIIVSYILYLLYVALKKSYTIEIYKGIFVALLIFLLSSFYIEGWMNRQLGTLFAIMAFAIRFLGTNETANEICKGN